MEMRTSSTPPLLQRWHLFIHKCIHSQKRQLVEWVAERIGKSVVKTRNHRKVAGKVLVCHRKVAGKVLVCHRRIAGKVLVCHRRIAGKGRVLVYCCAKAASLIYHQIKERAKEGKRKKGRRRKTGQEDYKMNLSSIVLHLHSHLQHRHKV